MTSSVRPFVISLLCGIAVTGQAPAWLHVNGCGHENHSRSVSPAAVSSPAAADASGHCHEACCHAADQAERGGERADGDEPGHSHDGHDSDSCVICQSLGLPTGVAWQLNSLAIVRFDVGAAKIWAPAAPESTSLSTPQPRGPPAPLA